MIARVTGDNPSELNGVLSLAGASFFLLNPNGVFVGPNAQLLVGGDIFLSTADRLRFGTSGDTFFDAHGETTMLSHEAPSSFGFLSPDPAPVGVYGSRLVNPAGGGEGTMRAKAVRWCSAKPCGKVRGYAIRLFLTMVYV